MVEKITQVPPKNNVWVFLLAGQSNMAGRGWVEPQDTMTDKRLLTINKNNEVILAKEPLHFYEPRMAGLDCGVSFGRVLLKNIPDNVTILLIPTAIGGSSIQQWLGDSTYRGVQLLTNFKEKVKVGSSIGVIKGVLWHQGESNANSEENIRLYPERLTALFKIFRNITHNDHLPILAGELGSYSTNNKKWQLINEAIKQVVQKDANATLISTQDFKHKGDNVHFNSIGERMIGERFATEYLKMK